MAKRTRPDLLLGQPHKNQLARINCLAMATMGQSRVAYEYATRPPMMTTVMGAERTTGRGKKGKCPNGLGGIGAEACNGYACRCNLKQNLPQIQGTGNGNERRGRHVNVTRKRMAKANKTAAKCS